METVYALILAFSFGPRSGETHYVSDYNTQQACEEGADFAKRRWEATHDDSHRPRLKDAMCVELLSSDE